MRFHVGEPLPTPVEPPQMLMPDGQIYRWEREDGGAYKHLKLCDGSFKVVATGDRKDAVEWAKTLRKVGGTHPYRSVTQLVARSFPLSLELYVASGRTTVGGPGSASFCHYERSVDLRIYADGRACLREDFREWGFGWSDRRPPVGVEIPRPFTEEGIREAAGTFRIETKGLYERITSCFPWLVG